MLFMCFMVEKGVICYIGVLSAFATLTSRGLRSRDLQTVDGFSISPVFIPEEKAEIEQSRVRQ